MFGAAVFAHKITQDSKDRLSVDCIKHYLSVPLAGRQDALEHAVMWSSSYV